MKNAKIHPKLIQNGTVFGILKPVLTISDPGTPTTEHFVAQPALRMLSVSCQLAATSSLTFTKPKFEFYYIKTKSYVVKCILGKKLQKITGRTLLLQPNQPQNKVVSPKYRWHEVAEFKNSQNCGF